MLPTCELSGEDLVAYDDKELRGARLEYVEAHLAVCPICQERLAGFRETARILRESTPLVDDPAARARLRARLEQEALRRTRIHPPRGLLLVVPVLLLLAALLTAPTHTTGAEFPLRRFIRDIVSGSGPPSRPPGPPNAWLPASTPHLNQSSPDAALSFPPVVPAELPGGFTRIEQSTPKPDLVQALYRSDDAVYVQLSEAPAGGTRASVPSSAEPLNVEGTAVLWLQDEPQSVSLMLWIRDNVLFELRVMQRASVPLSLDEAREIVVALRAEQDAGAGTTP